MDKKRIEEEVKVDKVKKKEKKEKVNKKIVKDKNSSKKSIYVGFSPRLLCFGFLFALLFALSYFLVVRSFSYSETKKVSYANGGTIDYKVYLKPNDFYEKPYLDKNMVYVTSLIKSINIDFNYQFNIDDPSDVNFDYDIVGTLQLSDDAGTNVYYSKDYTLLKNKKAKINKNTSYNARESIVVDYDYYNNLANKFKSSYGIDATSSFVIKFKLNSNCEEKSINETKNMTVTIPLSQRAINIKTDISGINDSKAITSESKYQLDNKLFIGIAVVLFIISVACLLKFLELVFLMLGKKSEYDKYLDNIFKNYDRLIVETKTMPRFDDKTIIKIEKFDELLDARDTLKQPIMYFNISSHNKCYFYINKGNDVFLTTIKAVDLEEKKNEKKKKDKPKQ